MSLPIVNINLLAVLVAGIASMVVGALWYSQLLFGKIWMQLMGFNEKKLAEAKKKGMAKSYIITFISSLLTAYILAHFVKYVQAATIADSLVLAFWIWLGFFATTMLGSILWEGKPLKLYVINILHYLVSLSVMSIILTVLV